MHELKDSDIKRKKKHSFTYRLDRASTSIVADLMSSRRARDTQSDSVERETPRETRSDSSSRRDQEREAVVEESERDAE